MSGNRPCSGVNDLPELLEKIKRLRARSSDSGGAALTSQGFLSHLKGVRPVRGGWQAFCPAHADKNPSLSVSQRNGKILLHCFAGCSTESIVEALGLKIADLFTDGRAESGGGGQIVKTYDYVNEAGNLLFQAVRFEPKGFRQRRPDGQGGWVWHLKCDEKCKCKVKLPPVRGVRHRSESQVAWRVSQ